MERDQNRLVSQSELSGPLTFCGRSFSRAELEVVRWIVAEFAALGITEISRTVCELLEWKRPNGGLKNLEWVPMPKNLTAAEREPYEPNEVAHHCGL